MLDLKSLNFDAILQGQYAEIDPNACLTSEQTDKQRDTLAALSDLVEAQNEVSKHVDALETLADDIALAATRMSNSGVRIAFGAYDPQIAANEDTLAETLFLLEAGVRAHANSIATKYGVTA
jgi:hypothetical protein